MRKCLIAKPHGEHVAVGDPLRDILIGAGSLVLKEEGDRQVVWKKKIPIRPNACVGAVQQYFSCRKCNFINFKG